MLSEQLIMLHVAWLSWHYLLERIINGEIQFLIVFIILYVLSTLWLSNEMRESQFKKKKKKSLYVLK